MLVAGVLALPRFPPMNKHPEKLAAFIGQLFDSLSPIQFFVSGTTGSPTSSQSQGIGFYDW